MKAPVQSERSGHGGFGDVHQRCALGANRSTRPGAPFIARSGLMRQPLPTVPDGDDGLRMDIHHHVDALESLDSWCASDSTNEQVHRVSCHQIGHSTSSIVSTPTEGAQDRNARLGDGTLLGSTISVFSQALGVQIDVSIGRLSVKVS
jgi:hypothetical protein